MDPGDNMAKQKPKTYKIHFLKGDVASSAEGSSAQNEISISTILSNIQNEKSAISPRYAPDEYYYDIAKKTLEKKGGRFQGVLRKFRNDDFPKVGKRGEAEERNLILNEGESLIEKNFFLYDTNRNVLLYQSTKPGSTYSKLAEYMGHVSGKTVGFSIIPRMRLDALLKDSLQRIKSFEIKIVRPPNVDDMKNRTNNWSSRFMDLLENTDASFMKLEVSANARTSKKNRLSRATSSFLKEYIAHSPEPQGKIHFVDDDNNPSVVDLILDRLIAEIQVSMEGNYPRTDSIFSEMRKKLDSDEIQDALNGY